MKNILKIVRIRQLIRDKSYTLWKAVYRGTSILLMHTGMGRENALPAFRSVASSYPITLCVSFGFAGALREGLSAGDGVICGTLLSREGPPLHTDYDMSPWCFSLKPVKGIATCRNISVASVVREREEKRHLHKNSGADTADMESYWIGKECREKGISFIAFRAVSDTVDDSLHSFDRLTSEKGRLCSLRIIIYVMLHPLQAGTFISLARTTGLCGKSIALFFEKIISRAGKEARLTV